MTCAQAQNYIAKNDGAILATGDARASFHSSYCSGQPAYVRTKDSRFCFVGQYCDCETTYCSQSYFQGADKINGEESMTESAPSPYSLLMLEASVPSRSFMREVPYSCQENMGVVACAVSRQMRSDPSIVHAPCLNLMQRQSRNP